MVTQAVLKQIRRNYTHLKICGRDRASHQRIWQRRRAIHISGPSGVPSMRYSRLSKKSGHPSCIKMKATGRIGYSATVEQKRGIGVTVEVATAAENSNE